MTIFTEILDAQHRFEASHDRPARRVFIPADRMLEFFRAFGALRGVTGGNLLFGMSYGPGLFKTIDCA